MFLPNGLKTGATEKRSRFVLNRVSRCGPAVGPETSTETGYLMAAAPARGLAATAVV